MLASFFRPSINASLSAAFPSRAIAAGEYLVALNYYIIKEFGPNWYDKLDVEITTPHCLNTNTIRRAINDNRLKATKIGTKWLIKKEDISNL